MKGKGWYRNLINFFEIGSGFTVLKERRPILFDILWKEVKLFERRGVKWLGNLNYSNKLYKEENNEEDFISDGYDALSWIAYF